MPFNIWRNTQKEVFFLKRNSVLRLGGFIAVETWTDQKSAYFSHSLGLNQSLLFLLHCFNLLTLNFPVIFDFLIS